MYIYTTDVSIYGSGIIYILDAMVSVVILIKLLHHFFAIYVKVPIV